MTETIFVGVAWPYANGRLHLGHVVGAMLAPDIFARFHRMRGSQVLMVSGSDTHGTPITLVADREGVSPAVIAERYHRFFLEDLHSLGISFDLFTHTETPTHHRVVQDMFLRLLERDYIYKATTTAPYDPVVSRFLPDRYVEGTCPHCGYTEARGDQCDNCGRVLDPADLIELHSRLSGAVPEFRETEHFYLRLSAFTSRLTSWVAPKTYWRPEVYGFATGLLREGLKDRPVTRDIEWGVPIPLPGYEQKRIYVWFDAFIGYLSASVEWAQNRGEPDAWKPFWESTEVRAYYFLGKDNIFFHTIMWPAVLMGYGGLVLPYDIPANQYMTMSGTKMSKSRGVVMPLHEYVPKYQADAVRYALTAMMPETHDTDLSHEDFVRLTNDEMVATYGNFVHRVLTFTKRHFDGIVPPLEGTNKLDQDTLDAIPATFADVGRQIARCQFRDSLRSVMQLAARGNRYLDECAPWHTIRSDRLRTGSTLHVCVQMIAALSTLMTPFLPFSSEQLRRQLGIEVKGTQPQWEIPRLSVGHQLGQPVPLFQKIVEDSGEESAR
ncbi:MAG: methionine--tRNA ligase [Chloroflexi bacterium]|nr:methionine--tRNA ligase [Chloroflexota bacterium]